MSDEQNIPAFLLKGAQQPAPPAPQTIATGPQLSAALLAYDMALPVGCERPPLREHMAAMNAAIAAALNVGDK